MSSKASEVGAGSMSRTIGRFVSDLQIHALSPADSSTLKFALMDCLACAIAGAREPVTRLVLDTLATQHGEHGKATILAHPLRSSALDAALANGIMAHACDFDDVSETMYGHPTAPALPAILAAAELSASTGHDVLLALAAAIEVMAKLGGAVGYDLVQSGWHPTAVLGVFGAAVGASKILGLDAEHTATAINIAASRAAGLRANVGTMVKPMHCGFAARDGLEAALFAAAGATANPSALDGLNGFLTTFASRREQPVDIVSRLGNPFDIREPGIVFKKYPSCLDTHSAIDAILDLRDSYDIQVDQVKFVRCLLPPGYGLDLNYPDPRTPLQGKFSMEFCAAVALARGRVSLAEFSQEVVDDPLVRRLIGISKVDFDPALTIGDGKGFSAPARSEITLKDGRVVQKTVNYMRGHPNNPMSQEEAVSKFKDCAEPVLGADRTRSALAIIEQFDQLSDSRLLMSTLGDGIS